MTTYQAAQKRLNERQAKRESKLKDTKIQRDSEVKNRQIIKGLIYGVIAIGIFANMFGGHYKPTEHHSVKVSKPKPAIERLSATGEIWQASWYIKQRLKDPDSYMNEGCTKVMHFKNGDFGANCSYRAKNGFGGYVKERMAFRFDSKGNVIKAVKY